MPEFRETNIKSISVDLTTAIKYFTSDLNARTEEQYKPFEASNQKMNGAYLTDHTFRSYTDRQLLIYLQWRGITPLRDHQGIDNLRQLCCYAHRLNREVNPDMKANQKYTAPEIFTKDSEFVVGADLIKVIGKVILKKAMTDEFANTLASGPSMSWRALRAFKGGNISIKSKYFIIPLNRRNS
jgi:hypothetical protein